MFESTIEAQALHAGDKRLGTLSAAAVAHLGIGLAIIAVTAVIVPVVTTPDPPEHVWWVQRTPIPPGDPTPPRPAPSPEKGAGPTDGSKALTAPRLEPLTQPTATPDTVPAAPEPGPGLDDRGPGTPGDSDGNGDGAPGSVGDGTLGSGGGDGDGGPRELTGDMQRPVLLVKVEPAYPTTARIARLPGRVVVQAVIGPDGSVESAEVLSSTSTLFDAAALDAVGQWRYRPALMNGRPVRVYFKVVVTFTIR